MKSRSNALRTIIRRKVSTNMLEMQSKSVGCITLHGVRRRYDWALRDVSIEYFKRTVNCRFSSVDKTIRRQVSSDSKRGGCEVHGYHERTISCFDIHDEGDHYDEQEESYQRDVDFSFVEKNGKDNIGETQDNLIEKGHDGQEGEAEAYGSSLRFEAQHKQLPDSDRSYYDRLLRKYKDMCSQSNLDSIIITDLEAEEIRSCLNYLETRVKRKGLSREYIHLSFHDAHLAETLLNLLLIAQSFEQQRGRDIKDRFVAVGDFEKVLTIWRYATRYLTKYLQYRGDGMKDAKDHFEGMLQYQRRVACRCLYASERAEFLLREMNRLSSEGYTYLRPTQYSYETVLGSWSLSSRELSYMLRGEGKAAGALQKISPRSALNSKFPEFVKNPWDNPSILERYGLLDPARKADELLENLFTLEDLDSTEFKASAWAIKQTIASWVHIKTRPRRFTNIKSTPKVDIVDEDGVDDELEEELSIPARAEELMWRLFYKAEMEYLDSRPMPPMNSIFRGVISAWSHSNHPNGQ
jgi:hypothetical protein